MTGTKIPVHNRPWRSWITQRIPIPENRGSNPFGRARNAGNAVPDQRIENREERIVYNS